jgi:hypothetical protein
MVVLQQPIPREASPMQDASPDFNFPFPPYPTQKELMKRIYSTIDSREIGILESPTGTVFKCIV